MKKPDRIQQKRARKRQREFDLRNSIKAWWESKNPILRFALGFVVLMGIFYGFWLMPIFTENVLTPVVRFNAWMAGKILGLLGYHPVVDDTTLTSPFISINVSVGCDALEPMAIFLFAVLLFPATLRVKLGGIAAGIPILFILNQFRIITLYIVGAHSDSLFGKDKEFYFNLIHLQVWPVIFIVGTLVLLAYWILFSLRTKNPQLRSSS